MSLKGRLDTLEQGYSGDGWRRAAVVCYDGARAPQDKDERAAFLEALRPPGLWDVTFVAVGDNGRDPELTRRLEAGYWIAYAPRGDQ